MSSSSNNNDNPAGSGYVDPTAAAVEHCESMARTFGDLAPQYEALAGHLRAKLWHPLTLGVMEFVSDVSNTNLKSMPDGTNSFLALYNALLEAKLDAKFNPTRWARIAAWVAESLQSSDPQAATAILEDLVAQPSTTEETKIFLEAHLHLATMNNCNSSSTSSSDAGNTNGKDALARVAAGLAKRKKSIAGVQQDIVAATYYRAAFTYYKIVGPPEQFYHAALQFLGYDDDNMDSNLNIRPTHSDYPTLAQDIGLAALTAEGVYNLQQAQAAPLVQKHLRDDPTNVAWWDLLSAVADGDQGRFAQLNITYEKQIAQQPALRATQVQEKLTLLALCRLVFARDPHDRVLSLTELAKDLQLNDTTDDNTGGGSIEWVVMRALSVGLIKGSMDQVAGTVHISWVQPRSLVDCAALATRMDQWATQVQNTRAGLVESRA